MRSKLSVGLALAALGASMGGLSLGYADVRRAPYPSPPRGGYRYRAPYAGRPAPGTKVARALGHDGAIYHTGALNKDDRASIWARGWNRSEGTYTERIVATRRYVEYCFGAGR